MASGASRRGDPSREGAARTAPVKPSRDEERFERSRVRVRPRLVLGILLTLAGAVVVGLLILSA